MKLINRSLIAILVTACLPLSAQAQAGFRQGMSMADLKALVGEAGATLRDDPYSLVISADTTSGPQAKFTMVTAPSVGLCRTITTGTMVSSDITGARLDSTFRANEAALDEKMGPHKREDHLKPGSRLVAQWDWMIALAKGERRLSATWSAAGGSTMPEGVAEVEMVAHGADAASGYVSVTYTYANYPACKAQRKSLKARDR